MKLIRDFICLVLAAVLLIGCEEKAIIHDMTPISYVKTEVDLGGFAATTDLLYEDGNIYIGGLDPNSSPALLVYNTASGEYETTPLDCVGRPECIAKTDDGIAYISRLDDDSIGYAVLHLADGIEIQLAELIPALAGTYYRAELISCGNSLYLTGNNECVRLGSSGKIDASYTYDGQIYYAANYSDDSFCFIVDNLASNSVYICDGGAPEYSREHSSLLLDAGVVRALYSGNDGEVFVRGDDRLFACDMETLTRRALVDWIDTEFAPQKVNYFSYVDDELLYVWASDLLTEQSQLYRLDKGEADLSDRIPIKISYVSTGGSEIEDAILYYNLLQNKYYAVADDLRDSVAEEKLDEAYDLAMVSGDIGDVIIFNRGASIEKYLNHGALADLYDYFNKDDSILLDDIFDFTYQHMERNGELYTLIPSFDIGTVVSKTSNFSQGFTFDEFMELLKNQSSDSLLINESRFSLTEMLLFAAIEDYMDIDTKTCDFTNEDFISTIEFLKSLPDESNAVYDDDPTAYSNDKILCRKYSFANIYGYLKLKASFGYEDISFIGNPSPDGGRDELYENFYVGISSQSKEPNGAWEFIKFMMDEFYQINNEYFLDSLPSLKNVMYDYVKTNPEIRIFIPENSTRFYTYFDPDEEIPEGNGKVTHINEDFINELYENLSDVNIKTEVDDMIRYIIREELSIYFSGAKSAADTAEVIQNRVQLYLNE